MSASRRTPWATILRPLCIVALTAGLAASAGACRGGGGGERAPGPTGKLRVAVSVLPQAYFLERIGGAAVEAVPLMPPGASPETYEPGMGVLGQLSGARLWLRVGLPTFEFEAAWSERILGVAPALRAVDTAAGEALSPDGNPHVWLSPRRVKRQAERIAAALSQADPPNASQYAAGLRQFQAELDALDRELGATLAAARDKSLLVFHPSWLYLAQDYGIHLLALEAEGRDPGPGHLESVLHQARTLGIKDVLVQPQIAPGSAAAVATGLGGSVRAVDPLARDWPASLRAAAQAFAELAR